jgi:hypothetical protein
VKATTDVPLASWIQNQRSVVTFADRKVEIRFDTSQILVDDVVQAKLPAGAKAVELRFAGGKFSLTADGKDVPKLRPAESVR